MMKKITLSAALCAALCGSAQEPLKVEAVVIPDYLGESLIIPFENGRDNINIPGDNLAVLLLADDGSTVLTMWKNPAADVRITPSGAIVSGNGEGISKNYPDSWFHATAALNDQEWLPVGWKLPYAADFRAIFRKETGVLPPENGRQEGWKIMPFRTDTGMQCDTSVAIYNGENWSNWISGYGGTFYPARADRDNVYLRFLHAGEYPEQKHDAAFGAYIYPDSAATHPQYWEPIGLAAKPDGLVMPKQAVEAFVGPELWQTVCEIENEGKWFPATCGTTEALEKIFYRSESYKNRDEVGERITNMNMFVRRIRERIEAFRAWGAAEKAWLKANAPESVYNAFAADFDEYEKYYQQFLPRMQQPEVSEKFSAEIMAMANDENGDDEVKEDRCKELGRAIRTIGGTQDTMAAQFRRFAKCIRQKATELYADAKDKKEQTALLHIRSTAGEVLRNRMPHEGK